MVSDGFRWFQLVLGFSKYGLSLSEMKYFNEIRINIENSKQLEEDKSNQKFRIKLNPDVTRYKITANNTYKVYIRLKQFESLVNIFLCSEEAN